MIKWNETLTSERCVLLTRGIVDPKAPGAYPAYNGPATLDDLRKACEAVGLVAIERVARMTGRTVGVMLDECEDLEALEQGVEFTAKSREGLSLAVQMGKLRARAEKAEAQLSAEQASCASMRRVLGVPDGENAITFAERLVARLAALTAPVEGEPSESELVALCEPPMLGTSLGRSLQSVWRAGHAAGLATEAPASGENATDDDLCKVWSCYSALSPTSLQASARRALYDLGKAHGYRGAIAESAKATTTPRDLPRATDEEFLAMADEAHRARELRGEPLALNDLVLAVAGHVRREQCLVTRAVERRLDLMVTMNNGGASYRVAHGQNTELGNRKPLTEVVKPDVAPSDVARVLAEMLGEVVK